MSIAVLRSRLTDEDVRKLVKGETDQARAMAAHKICRRIGLSKLGAEERGAADEILGYMARDAAVMVRRALSVTLKNSPHLSHDIAVKLAHDIDAIAQPILEESPVLTDDDLIAIVRAGLPAKQTAIARRAAISTDVVSEIVQHGVEEAVATLAANDGAAFDETAYLNALDRFADAPRVAEAFLDRTMMPPMVAEKLIAHLSDLALQKLVKKHALPPQLAVELAESTRERATIDILDQAGCQQDMRRFVQQLILNGRLTPSLVLRGLCLGHMPFFEHAMAELAGVPHQKAWLLVHDAGPLGLRAVFERTGLPGRLYGAVRAAVDVYHEIELDGGPADRERFTERMIERVLTRHQGMSRDEIDYLLEKLDALQSVDEVDADPFAAPAEAKRAEVVKVG